MATEWYYAKDGEKLGPVTTQVLKELAASGQLDTQDLIWRTGLEAWQPADRVRGLFPGGTMPPPLPIPTSERPYELGPAREAGDLKPQPPAKLGDGILDAAKGMADRARGFAGSDEVKDAVGRTKKAVAGLGDRAKDVIQRVKTFPKSDEAKDAMTITKKHALELGGNVKGQIRSALETLGNLSRLALLVATIFLVSMLFVYFFANDKIMVGTWKNQDGATYRFLDDGTGIWNSPWGRDNASFKWNLEGGNAVIVKGLFGGDRVMPLGTDKQSFILTPMNRPKETFKKIEE